MRSRKWYTAKVTAANSDGTYNLAYDDGDRESNVRFEHIRRAQA